jgi:hypothetical protein
MHAINEYLISSLGAFLTFIFDLNLEYIKHATSFFGFIVTLYGLSRIELQAKLVLTWFFSCRGIYKVEVTLIIILITHLTFKISKKYRLKQSGELLFHFLIVSSLFISIICFNLFIYNYENLNGKTTNVSEGIIPKIGKNEFIFLNFNNLVKITIEYFKRETN